MGAVGLFLATPISALVVTLRHSYHSFPSFHASSIHPSYSRLIGWFGVFRALLTALLIWSPITRRWLGVRLGRLSLAAYMFYILVMDRLTARQAGRPNHTLRQHRIWHYVSLPLNP
jgi:hypothetical protein